MSHLRRRVMWLWSPRRRGWTRLAVRQRRRRIVVPAQAGVDPISPAGRRTRPGGPRAGGGGPVSSTDRAASTAWSPRRRGWTAAGEGGAGVPTVVPAQGGGGPPGAHATPSRYVWSPRRRGVDLAYVRANSDVARGPRAGGGGPKAASALGLSVGWSPRRRGWTAGALLVAVDVAVVPAQAGVDRLVSHRCPCVPCGPRAGGGGARRCSECSAPPTWSPRRRAWTFGSVG